MKQTIKLLLIPIFFLVTSCAAEDLAMLGAVATGAAANYAGANGDAATAASLVNTQQQIMNEQANTATVNASVASSQSTYVTANAVPGSAGFDTTPFSGKMLNVQGVAAGILVADPASENGRFLVPKSSGGTASFTSTYSGTGTLVGTWSNAAATWNPKSNGDGIVTIPTTIQNDIATTYLKWKADASSGTFAYTIPRMTHTGSLNCDDTYDYDKSVNKPYSAG